LLSGLYDSIPKNSVFSILVKYLPPTLYLKLKKFVTADYNNLRSHVHWPFFKNQLDKINLEKCSSEILTLFYNKPIEHSYVKTFHINNNDCTTGMTEPTITNTTLMVSNFITYIYQRNVLASLLKYIILKPILLNFANIEKCKKKGIFSDMQNRLNEIVFECILTAFNGSNYDNYLLCNYLIIIQKNLDQKIKMFKKGASISTIILTFDKNINTTKHFNFLKKKKSKILNYWPCQLYIKDVRNLVSANMSLDKVGSLFNLNIPKLCFPYNKATSIKILKTLNNLKPNDEQFWADSFSNKTIALDVRLNAQKLFDQKNFSNLYEYGTFYLIQDCVLLHSIVLTLFNSYLKDEINLFIRRNYSQSSLSYQQFFILEQAKQIQNTLAPQKINNPFFNYFIKQAVTGGLCTSFVHGVVDKNTIINEHFNYLEYPNLNQNVWPNFANIKENWKKGFTENPSGISTIDIRSLYPSAACKKIPVNLPLFFSRFIAKDFEKVNKNKRLITYNLNGFCTNVKTEGNINTDFFKLLNFPPRFKNEYNAINNYINKLPKNITILRFQTNFTALGQLFFGDYPLDGFLSYKNFNDEKVYIKLIQYNSSFYHGHLRKCCLFYENQPEFEKTQLKLKNIEELYKNILHVFQLENVIFEIVELSDCDYFLHQIPSNDEFLFSFKNHYTYNSFLQSIYNKQLTGFLVVKDLEIRKENQNPIFGFLIQKIEYELKNLSPYTQQHLNFFQKNPRVIGVNKSKSFFVISTEYFNWLHKTFGFQKTPEIFHALLFQTNYYLKKSIENKLQLRKDLKHLIKIETCLETKQNYEIRAELIKLMLNSCYGFTLCNLTSTKYKFYTARKSIPTDIKRKKNWLSCIQITENVYLIELKKKQEASFQTLLGHVGCYILFNSKIILIKRLYFLLKFLNPQQAQLLYMDTDSAHFLVKHKNFEENVDNNLKKMFLQYFSKHFETGNKLSGIWVQEGFFNVAEYIGEKCYKLYNEDNHTYVTHMKGLSFFFQNQYVQKQLVKDETPCIAFSMFTKSPDFVIFKSYMGKNIFNNYIPIKRYFISASGSLPLKFC